MITNKFKESTKDLLRNKHKNDRLFLYLGSLIIITIACSITFLLFMTFPII